MAGKWNLSWHHRALRIASLWENGITGRGVTVALLDSGLARPAGLDRGHFEYLDANGQPISPFDPTGHGTCCGSVIASRRGGALGVAPEAKVVSFRVLETANSGADVEAALLYILENRPDIDVLSCSFIVDVATDAMQETVRRLSNAGKVVIAAAGDRQGQRCDFPELTQNAVTIAAVDQQWRPLPGVTTGPWIDLAAPGSAIPALVPGLGPPSLFGQSSAAAAVISGVTALALSTRPAGADRRRLAIGLDGLLKATAHPVAGVDPNAIGVGVVDVTALIAAASAIPSTKEIS